MSKCAPVSTVTAGRPSGPTPTGNARPRRTPRSLCTACDVADADAAASGAATADPADEAPTGDKLADGASRSRHDEATGRRGGRGGCGRQAQGK